MAARTTCVCLSFPALGMKINIIHPLRHLPEELPGCQSGKEYVRLYSQQKTSWPFQPMFLGQQKFDRPNLGMCSVYLSLSTGVLTLLTISRFALRRKRTIYSTPLLRVCLNCAMRSKSGKPPLFVAVCDYVSHDSPTGTCTSPKTALQLQQEGKLPTALACVRQPDPVEPPQATSPFVKSDGHQTHTCTAAAPRPPSLLLPFLQPSCPLLSRHPTVTDTKRPARLSLYTAKLPCRRLICPLAVHRREYGVKHGRHS